jgi:hypothetical protein
MLTSGITVQFPPQPASRLIQLTYLSIITVVLVFFFKYPPLADYIEWIYQSYIFNELIRNGHGSDIFYIRSYPVPYVISQVLMAGLNIFMPPLLAGKATLAIYLMLAGWLSKKFVQRHELDPVLAYPLLLCCIIFNSSFWSGYSNYQFGLLVLMAYLSLSEIWQRKIWVNAAFGLLAFSSHGFCLLAFGVIAGLKACTLGWRAVFSFSLACVPAFLLTLWYMVARNNDSMQALEAAAPYLSAKFWAYKIYTLTKAGPYQNFMLGSLSDLDRLPAYYYVGSIINIALGMLLALLHVRVFKHRQHAKTLHLSLAVGVLGLTYIIAPSLAMQVVNPGERILYPELLCVFAVALKNSPKEKFFGCNKNAIAIIIYVFMAATVVNLMFSTTRQGYQRVTQESFSAAQKNYLNVLYWHRPYQFQSRSDYLEQVSQIGAPLKLPIIFPTSLVANKLK